MLTGAGRGLSLTKRTARKLSGDVEVLELDVTVPEHLAQVRDELTGKWGHVDGVLHAIGFAPGGLPRRRLHGRAVGRRGRRAARLDVLPQGAGRRLRAADVVWWGVRRSRLRQPRGVAGVQLDGRGEVGAAERQPLPRQATRAAGHPLEPRRRRTDQDDRRQEHSELQQVRGHLGRPRSARLGRSTTRRRWPRRASPCSRTGSPRPPARSSTSTAASTPPAPESLRSECSSPLRVPAVEGIRSSSTRMPSQHSDG